MNQSELDNLVDTMDSEMGAARLSARQNGTLRPLQEWFEKWMTHPLYKTGNGLVQTKVLHEAAYLYADSPSRQEFAWELLLSAGRDAHRTNDEGYKACIRIALLELLPQKPYETEDIQRLFDCLDDPEARWMAFDAYCRAPRTFARHTAKYGRGRISTAEFANWLKKWGYVVTTRGIRLGPTGWPPSTRSEATR